MQDNRYNMSSRGFTLVELMVAMALSLFLMGGAILMYLSVQSTYDDTNRLSRLQENVRFGSDYLVRDFRNAGFSDEISLTIGQEILIQEKYAEVLNDGRELRVRYAGRGHCERPFNNYQVVQNRYWLDTGTGELRCTGSTEPDFDDSGDGMALVGGLTALRFELLLPDGTPATTTGEVECGDMLFNLAAEPCLGVRVGLEFEAMRDMDSPGERDHRYVELLATFRNAAIGHIYGDLDT